MNLIAHDVPRSRSWTLLMGIGDVGFALAAMALADDVRRIVPFGALPDRYYLTWQVLLLVGLIWAAASPRIRLATST